MCTYTHKCSCIRICGKVKLDTKHTFNQSVACMKIDRTSGALKKWLALPSFDFTAELAKPVDLFRLF